MSAKKERSEEMRISEVAKLTGLADSNIRFYEKKGLLAPQRETDS